MDEVCFWNDTELILALFRLTSPGFDSRPFVLNVNQSLVVSLERITKQSECWKLGEWEIHSLLDSLLDGDRLSTALQSFSETRSIVVICERENEWVDERLKLSVKQDAARKISLCVTNENPSVNSGVDLIQSVLSAVLKNTDSFAVLRLFDQACPDILPALKRLAAESQLTLLQTMFSYLMKLEIDGGSMENLAFKRHEKMLRSFNTAIDLIEEKLCEEATVRKLVSKALDIAVEWISSISTLSSEIASAMQPAASFCKGHLDIVISNYRILERDLKPCEQKRPQFVKDAHVVLRMLIDRLTMFTTTALSNVHATPAFQTPVVTVSTPVAQPSGVKIKKAEETPKTTQCASRTVVYSKFLNFDTPCAVESHASEARNAENTNTSKFSKSCATPSGRRSSPKSSGRGRSRLSGKLKSKMFLTEAPFNQDNIDESSSDPQKSKAPKKKEKVKGATRKRKSADQQKPKASKSKKGRKSEPNQRKITSFFGVADD
ncbi:hypothetical protein L596_003803 [Steinernema carpocapsae]|uniref:Uncharacterized protein n=1 Tax=Steinernema carpocapsae TaxID=34508 RepID=A0A4U8UUT1_STECR|nr:hypothetical protein L596_003803 [Steinernema carpocapsae]